ncbi:hypothetical protein EVG20_g4668 [Dentipellis fragilis]|uniref:Uncharacterized protein n=1 Tax=Dentipellis fragilis TaxID=205917 RepID=A0A4Y9YV08_9AGAM|nr:hypothetical protein EVG20_g4668 [Dentipellis fragilis]
MLPGALFEAAVIGREQPFPHSSCASSLPCPSSRLGHLWWPAGPINGLRSSYVSNFLETSYQLTSQSLIPTPPPASVGQISNSPLANTTIQPDLSNSTTTTNTTYISNSTVLSNPTSTTFLDPDDLPDFSNSTILSNSTSSLNSTDLDNSTRTIAYAANSTMPGTVLGISTNDNSTATGNSAGAAPGTSSDTTSDSDSNSASASVSTDFPNPTDSSDLSSASLAPALPTPTSTNYNSPRAIVPKWLLMRVPKFRRIAQSDLPAVPQSWQDPCAQQHNADAMVDFAKSAAVANHVALITNAIAYRQHLRNAIVTRRRRTARKRRRM